MLDNYQVTKLWNEWLLKVSAMMFTQTFTCLYAWEELYDFSPPTNIGLPGKRIKKCRGFIFQNIYMKGGSKCLIMEAATQHI